MACTTATAPIDISSSKITGNCDYKCAYSFFYNNSSCVAHNQGDLYYLSISYDKSSSPPVVYNSAGYDVYEIRIYSPSLHTYSGSKTDAEMIIIHNSNTGANPLLVCIPIKSSNTSTVSALFFRTLINTVANSAPANGETTTVNAPNFNLNELVPHKPFYSYTATVPYQPCNGQVEYVVFDPQNAYLDMMPETLQRFYNIIPQNPYNPYEGPNMPNLFFNQKGPGSGGVSGNEIYIDCQPVGASENTTQMVTDMGSGTGSISISIQDWLNNPYVRIVLGSLIFVLLLYGVKNLLGVFHAKKGGSVSSTTGSSGTAMRSVGK